MVFSMIAYIPKKVKNSDASIPSMRAPFAMMSPGYTSSSDPCETTIDTFVMGSAAMN
jgi:hypothetical protein